MPKTSANETVFHVPRLLTDSVACGGCCPVPAEAVILPELDLVPGVIGADADWQRAEVRVRHLPHVQPRVLAEILADVGYPAESWSSSTGEHDSVE